MTTANNQDSGKLLSDRGPAQPSGSTGEAANGPNNIHDQHAATPNQPVTPQKFERKTIEDNVPPDNDPDDPAQP